MENRKRRPARQSRSSAGQRQQPPSSHTSPIKKGKSRWFRAIVMVLGTVVLCGFLALFILQSALDLFGLNQDDEQVVISIPENPSLQQISSILAKAGVVEHQITFQVYATLKEDEQYYGGEYLFNRNMGYDEILRDLRTESRKKETVTISFPEGRNAYEIAKALEEENVCDADEFLEYLETADLGYEFIDQLPDTALRFRRLEGYLFPDTYEFYVGENVDSVIRKKFLNNFNSKITTEMRNRMWDLNLTLDQAIVLASIIQKETGGVGGIDTMKLVSSVFHNRLDYPEKYPKLQSDVTRDYVNSYIKPFQDMQNQDMYDAYNTYVGDGLPVGAISNPGMDAITAALYPEDTSYYFFVTDVQGKFYYAETAEKHYENIAIASKVEGEGKLHGIDTE